MKTVRADRTSRLVALNIVILILAALIIIVAIHVGSVFWGVVGGAFFGAGLVLVGASETFEGEEKKK